MSYTVTVSATGETVSEGHGSVPVKVAMPDAVSGEQFVWVYPGPGNGGYVLVAVDDAPPDGNVSGNGTGG